MTLRNIEQHPDKDLAIFKPYLYLDESYPRIRGQVGKAMKTIWLNETDQFAPGGWPVQDVDILSLDALVDLEAQLRNPTLEAMPNLVG